MWFDITSVVYSLSKRYSTATSSFIGEQPFFALPYILKADFVSLHEKNFINVFLLNYGVLRRKAAMRIAWT